jgi:hypothetical protein
MVFISFPLINRLFPFLSLEGGTIISVNSRVEVYRQIAATLYQRFTATLYHL